MKLIHTKKNSGFTLIETLVAIAIFTISMLAIMAVLSNSIANTAYAKKKMIATYLAQEGVEYVRNMRDTFVLYQASNTNGWDDFRTKMSLCDTEEGKSCYFDDQNLDYGSVSQPITQIIVWECPLGQCPYLFYDPSTGKYNYLSGEDTDFSRKINITNTNNEEMKVSSTVTWMQGSGKYEITLTTDLFDWTQ